MAGSQTRTAPSSPVVASIDPSPLKATLLMSTSWPWKDSTDSPVSASRMSISPESSGPSVTKCPVGAPVQVSTDPWHGEHDP